MRRLVGVLAVAMVAVAAVPLQAAGTATPVRLANRPVKADDFVVVYPGVYTARGGTGACPRSTAAPSPRTR